MSHLRAIPDYPKHLFLRQTYKPAQVQDPYPREPLGKSKYLSHTYGELRRLYRREQYKRTLIVVNCIFYLKALKLLRPFLAVFLLQVLPVDSEAYGLRVVVKARMEIERQLLELFSQVHNEVYHVGHYRVLHAEVV